MKKEEPFVCIIITNWNGGEKVLKCVSSLIKKTTYKNYKIILVDNGSKDSSHEKIKNKYKQIDVLCLKENIGFTKGTNTGWSYAFKNYKPDYICDMNNDIITIQGGWLTLMVKELEKDKNLGICANKLIDYQNRLQSLFFSKDYPERKRWYDEKYSKDQGQYDFVIEADAVPGGNMLIKKNVIGKVRGLDENFFYGPDDIDFCLRSRKAGFKVVFCGLSKSIHFGSFSYTSNFTKTFLFKEQIYGQMIFNFRHGNFKEKILSPPRQLLRAIMTRKDTSAKHGFLNVHFHKKFLERIS
ncbi:MAG: glycosyltransferase family 2 protein, partial [Nanoarchaeota archaeon]